MGENGLSRKEREEEARKAHILDVTERLFAEKGLHDTAVADIAREAEFGVGTIYKYFKDRDTLTLSLIGDRLNSHFDELELSLKEGETPRERIASLIDAYIHSMNRRKRFFRVYFTNFHPGAHDECCRLGKEDLIMERRKRVIGQIENVFRKGVEAGQFVGIDPQYLAAAMFGMAISFAFLADHKFAVDGQWDVDGMKAALKKILFNGLLREDCPEQVRNEELGA